MQMQDYVNALKGSIKGDDDRTYDQIAFEPVPSGRVQPIAACPNFFATCFLLDASAYPHGSQRSRECWDLDLL